MAVERVKDFFTLLAGVCPFAVKPGVKVYPAAGSGKILCLHGLGGPDQDSLSKIKRNKKREPAGSRSL